MKFVPQEHSLSAFPVRGQPPSSLSDNRAQYSLASGLTIPTQIKGNKIFRERQQEHEMG